LIKAADMMIARRADTKARADFATWKMMAKLNGASALPAEAETFLVSYKALLNQMPESDATDATIQLMYRAYYAEMGGHGVAPDVRAQMSEPVTGNVTAFKRPVPQKPRAQTGFRAGFTTGPDGKPKLPVALIFACLVVVYVGFRYYWR
jgi:hypothetical protein